MPQLFLAQNASSGPVKSSQRRLVNTMLAAGVDFHEAVRRFQSGYIAYVIAENGGHLGKAATELGMHKNTLTRTLRHLAGK